MENSPFPPAGAAFGDAAARPGLSGTDSLGRVQLRRLVILPLTGQRRNLMGVDLTPFIRGETTSEHLELRFDVKLRG